MNLLFWSEVRRNKDKQTQNLVSFDLATFEGLNYNKGMFNPIVVQSLAQLFVGTLAVMLV